MLSFKERDDGPFLSKIKEVQELQNNGIKRKDLNWVSVKISLQQNR